MKRTRVFFPWASIARMKEPALSSSPLAMKARCFTWLAVIVGLSMSR